MQLYQVTRKKDFVWNEPQEEAFQVLKQSFASPQLLAIVNKKDSFILDTDASDKVIRWYVVQFQQ